MKHTLTAIAAIIMLGFFTSCTKGHTSGSDTIMPNSQGTSGQHSSLSNLRLTTPNNSQSIPLDTANMMLNSYLTSVGYPSVDTAVRSLSIDADTLRAYLQNSNIVTVKFMLAHSTNYIHSDHAGLNAGLNPAAMTMIVVGLDDDEQYVLNNMHEVYDHLSPCPNLCQSGIGDAYIY